MIRDIYVTHTWYVTSGASKIWFLHPLQSPWLILWCRAGLIIAIHYMLAWASRTSRNSSVFKILLLVPSHKLSKYQHITPVLKDLHWLPVTQQIEYKISLLTFKAIMNGQPSYLHQMLSIPQTHYSSTRSSQTAALFIPRTRTSTGKRAFSVHAPRIWNSLPAVVRTTTSFFFSF